MKLRLPAGLLFAIVMAALCGLLGTLQYRWIDEVSRADRDRLRYGLQDSLRRISRDFNSELTAVLLALLPENGEAFDIAYPQRYAAWRESARQDRLVRRVGVTVPAREKLDLYVFESETGRLVSAEWPAEWIGLRDRLIARMNRAGFGPPPFFASGDGPSSLMEVPRFVRGLPRGPGGPPRAIDWLLVEIDAGYAASTLIPEILDRHLNLSGQVPYQAKVTARNDPSLVLFQSGLIESSGDARVGLFDIQYDQMFRRVGGRMFEGRGKGMRTDRPPRMEPPMTPPERGRWLLTVRHGEGSLDAVVQRARMRNLAVSFAILLLMLGAVAALVRYTRRAQRLADLQMEFVTGVSHELRTPLSVIRTAAHNLGDGRVSSPRQVERYGSLIADQSDRLTQIVEQILRFAGAKAGKAIAVREAVPVRTLVDDALAATKGVIDESGCAVEVRVDPALPQALADPTALKHALQNLLINAAKHGASGAWIGVTACDGGDGKIEIRVADRGPGIPREELPYVFDPFFRGRKALEDQVHGTGLGLNLVKKIVEAHGGSVTVESKAGLGAEFVLRIPVAPAALQRNEIADPIHRG